MIGLCSVTLLSFLHTKCDKAPQKSDFYPQQNNITAGR